MSIFSNKIIGLDISDNTMEVVLMEEQARKVVLVSKNRSSLEEGIVKNGEIVNEDLLEKEIKRLFATAKPEPIDTNKVIFGLSGNQTFTHTFKTEASDKKEIDRLVDEEVNKTFLIGAEDLLYTYKILDSKKDSEGKDVVIVATSKNSIAIWNRLFKKMNLDVEMFDLEVLASFRSLFKRTSSKPVCITDIGPDTTSVSIFDNTGLKYSFVSDVSGNQINKDSAKELVDDIKEKFEFIEKNGLEKISKVILIGGVSQTKGIDKFFTEQIGVPILIGRSVDIPEAEPLEYLKAAGLALRGLQAKWDKKDPGFLADDLLDVVVKKKIEVKHESEQEPVEDGVLEEIVEEEVESTEPVDSPEAIDSSKLGEEKRENSRINRKPRNSKKQLATLLVILLVGVMGIFGLWYAQENSQVERYVSTESQVKQFDNIQTFNVKVPVAVSPSEFNSDRVNGRIIENDIDSVDSYEKARKLSIVKVEKKINPGETFWNDPIDSIGDEESMSPPISFRWLVYVEDRLNQVLEKEAASLIDGQEYELTDIVKTGLVSVDNENVYYILGEVTLAIDFLVEEEENSSLEELE
jgi:Tfp pilus assembly PilM family ATPase